MDSSTRALISDIIQANIDKIVEELENHPEKVLPTKEFVFSESAVVAAPKSSDSTAEEEPFHNSYRKLYRMPKDFSKEYICFVSGGKLTVDTLTILEKNADGTLRAIFYFAFNVAPSTPWPVHCHNKKIFRKTFQLWHDGEVCGKRLANIVLKEVDGKLYVDWNKWGYYIIIQTADGKYKVCYTPKREDELFTTTLDFPITGAVDILQNWSPTGAQLKVGKITTSIIDLFTREVKSKIEQAVRVTPLIARFAVQAKAIVDKEMPSPPAPEPNTTNHEQSDAQDSDSSEAPPPEKKPRTRISTKSVCGWQL